MRCVAVYTLIGVAFMCGGCAFQRAQVATDAQNTMIGLTREQVLACIGAAREPSEGRGDGGLVL